ncbi:alcohol dehydrogenase catalytic domain-containing protein [Microbacterium trichothecenolyticum]|uniref:Geraniol dehydrogenase n=1 Tax=Microbacterium trichothecenolyticum TaxID=69370 RepID=A0A0M2H8A0_MICTR|nr:alcohol dehydrogenase catalytic domain-containing protein [Microbacterium trichothecenolyticum]KJL42785.1 Geraniol dehydrogenase [Microbacterium trichothecenolyticum]
MTAAVAALVRERGGSVALTDVALRSPDPRELVVKVMASGVCPTDLFGIDGGAGDRFPAVFGHEGAGIVEAVGAEVTRVRPGDRVVLGFGSCGACGPCRDGHPAYCDRFAELNYAPRSDAATAGGEHVTTGWMAQSSWATRIVVHESSAVPIGDDVPWAVAATLGCGILTGAGTVLNVLRPAPGDALLVLGAGTTGLAAVMAAAHRGVARIVVSDPVEARRTLALEVGATEVIAPDDLAALRPAPSFSHVLDTAGTQPSIDAALAAVAPRGIAATVALKPGANPVAVSQSRLLWGRTLTGVIEGDADIARDVPLLAALWRAGRLPVERLVGTYAFADAQAAIADARAGRLVKPVLEMETVTVTDAAAAASVRSLVDRLREGVSDDDLAALWRSLPAVGTAQLRGLWQGWAVTRDHHAGRLLERSRWYGKLFRSDDDVAPIVCETDDGALLADTDLARGGATLRTIVHDGVATASMVYDGQPIIDHFVRLGADTVLGVMTGRDTDDRGRAFYFVLEHVEDRPVAARDTTPTTAHRS